MRNNNIDAMRMVAAFWVVALHVGVYSGLPRLASDLIAGYARWAVPFFFMITGYYTARPGTFFPNVTTQRLVRLAGAFAVGFLVYLPYQVLTAGPGSINVGTLVAGTMWHLWFLTAVPMGLIVLALIETTGRPPLAPLISVALIVLYLAASFLAGTGEISTSLLDALRHVSGVPFILAGCLFALIKPQRAAPFMAALIVGLLLVPLEALVAQSVFAGSIRLMQILPSTLLITGGLFGLCLTVGRQAPDWLASWGRQDALGIYIYHVGVIILITSVHTGRLGFEPASIPGLPLLAATFVLTALLVRGLRVAGLGRLLADGDVSALAPRTQERAGARLT